MDDKFNIEEWYRQQVEGMRETPDEEVWNRLDRSLDVESVWLKLAVSLNIWEKKLLILRWFSAVAIMLFVSLAAFWQLQNKIPEIFKSRVESNATKIVRENSNIVGVVFPVSNSVNFSENETIPKTHTNGNTVPTSAIVNKTSASSEKIERSYQASSKGIENNTNLNKDLLVEKAPLKSALISNALINNAIEVVRIKASFEQKFEKQYYIGLTGGIGNQWLLSSETMSGLNKEGLDYARIDFGFSAGLTAGVKIKNNFGIETRLIWDQSGQRYTNFIEGKSVNKELNFNYFQADVLAKFRCNKNRLSNSGKWIAGVYGRYVLNATMELDKQKSSLDESYEKIDLGVIVGYELNYNISQHISIAPALRLQQGVMNTFKGTSEIPASFDYTLHSAAQFNLTLRYTL